MGCKELDMTYQLNNSNVGILVRKNKTDVSIFVSPKKQDQWDVYMERGDRGDLVEKKEVKRGREQSSQ